MNNYNIIHTQNYLLIVDDSEIKYKTWYLDDANQVRQCVVLDTDYWKSRKDYKKIISHLPVNNSPILEGVDLLPPLEDDLKQLGIDRTIERKWNPNSLETKRVANEIITAVEYGYNKAKEKYKYTEEDMIEAMLQISEYYANNINKDVDGHKKSLDIIQSLQKPKIPVGFKCKIAHERWGVEEGIFPKLKTTTNSQGLTQWVGEYIY